MAISESTITRSVFIPDKYVFSSTNRDLFIAYPSLKVKKEEYAVAEFITQQLPQGSAVLAPDSIAWMLPCFRRSTNPIGARIYQLKGTFLHHLNLPESYKIRLNAMEWAEGKIPLDPTFIHRIIATFDIRGIAAVNNAQNLSQIKRLLLNEGFSQYSLHNYYVWFKLKSS